MFDCNRFFNLLREWKKDNSKAVLIPILKDVMNHYFDSLAGTRVDNSKLKIRNCDCFESEHISYVLDEIGYCNYSIEFPKGKTFAIVTLRNSL